MTALEISLGLDYGERYGKNIIGTSEYIRNLESIKLFE